MKHCSTFMLLVFCISLPAVAAPPAADLTGAWKMDGGGDVYVRQLDNQIWWYGEENRSRPGWSHVAQGSISGQIIQLSWADVPKGSMMNHGTLRVEIVSGNELVIREETGGFAGTRLTRQKSVGVSAPALEKAGPPDPSLFKIKAYGPINHPASLLIDGNTVEKETEWQDAAGVWWEAPEVHFILDLGKRCLISDLMLQADNNDDYQIEYSLDGTAYKPLMLITEGMGEAGTGFDTFSSVAGTAGYLAALDFAKPVEARYLKISGRGGDSNYALAEIVVR